MGLAIENCKGHVHVFSDEGNTGGAGFYAIEPPIPDGADSKALIMGVPLAFQEIVQPVTTLDDRRILYIFGTAWSEMSVAGMLLLGDASTRGQQLSELLGWYEQNRVSVLKGPISVSLGTTGVDAFVVGLRLGQANAKNNTQMFSLILMTTDTQT